MRERERGGTVLRGDTPSLRFQTLFLSGNFFFPRSEVANKALQNKTKQEIVVL